ncbi:hypothetical protein BJV74DRAFT_757476, partial [Russula compacta]
MLKAAKTHGANFAAIRLSTELKKQLPAWYQIGAIAHPMNTGSTQCLLRHHKARTIDDLVKTSEKLKDPPGQPHRHFNFCNCQACQEDQKLGCTTPHDCETEAQTRITLAIPKHNPLYNEQRNGELSLTPRRKYQNSQAQAIGGSITFNPTLSSKDSIDKCFRVF